jgi:hypothetical protein
MRKHVAQFVNKSGRLVQPIAVVLNAWGTLTTLPAGTKLRDIRRVRSNWAFAAYDKDSDTWTSCATHNDLGAALGLVPRVRK